MSVPPEQMRYLLRIRQGLPLNLKVKYTLRRISMWYEHFDGMVYVAFSGGKDSTVLSHLVHSLYPNVPLVFADTGNELDSVCEFVATYGDRVTVVRPKMTFDEVIEKYGYPVVNKEQAQRIWEVRNTKSQKLRDIRMNGYPNGSGKISEKWKFVIDAPFKVTSKCCGILKCAPSSIYGKQTGRKEIVGTMAVESRLRKQTYIKNGCNAFDLKSPASRPLMFWTEQDVLRYIVDNRLGIAGAYGNIVDEGGTLRTTGEERTGCKQCLFGAHKDAENRIQRLARIEPESYRHAIEDLHYDVVMDYLGLEWRPLADIPVKADPQLDLFVPGSERLKAATNGDS